MKLIGQTRKSDLWLDNHIHWSDKDCLVRISSEHVCVWVALGDDLSRKAQPFFSFRWFYEQLYLHSSTKGKKGSGNINSLFLWLSMCDLFGEILMIFDQGCIILFHIGRAVHARWRALMRLSIVAFAYARVWNLTKAAHANLATWPSRVCACAILV